MKNKYRENALDPKDLSLLYKIGPEGAGTLMEICLVDFKNISYKQYVRWAFLWKQAYQLVSNDIKNAKETNANANRESLRVIANTLLNVRQYALDARRAAGKKTRLP